MKQQEMRLGEMERGHSNGSGHICQCLSKLLAYRGEATLTISGLRRRTGQEFVDGVLSLASGLRHLGVKRGHVVAISALNSEWYMEWLLAVASVGAIAAPLNYRWRLEEARNAIEVVNPVMLVVDDFCSAWASTLIVPSLKYRVLMAEFPSLIDTNGDLHTLEIKIESPHKVLSKFNYLRDPKDIALICFTSGTTGRPKGVAISHMSLIVQALAKIAIVGHCEDDVYLHMAPLCHIGGLSSCIAVLMSGGCHVFTPKFDAQRALQTIEQSHVTSLITVPAMMADLITCARQWNRWNCGESVKKILNGGGGLTSQLLSGATKLFPYAKLISAYGMTEACSSITFLTLHEPIFRNYGHAAQNAEESPSEFLRHHHLGGSCVGKPPAHIEVHICNDINGSTLCVGRILTRGPHVMIGYWGVTSTSEDPEHSFDWLDTGDMGWMDATGNLWLLGRTRDMVKSGGENIYPEEVEHLLLQHPGISKVAVVGVPDYRLSEIVVACVNLKGGWKWVDDESPYSPDLKEVSGAILQHLCRKNLTRFKIPKHFIHWKEPFPQTSTGKLKRDVVRREMTNHLQFLQSNL